MVILKTNPAGIDIPIQDLQQELYDHLLTEWDLTEDQINFYGRAQRNQKKGNDDGYVAEVYVGKKEYVDAYLNDKVAATIFFTTPERTANDASNGHSVAQLGLIFSVNLDKLPTIPHRGDEEAQQTISKFFVSRPSGFSFIEKVTGIQNVLAEYTAYRNRSEMKFRDMQPYCLFRFNLELRYDTNFCEQTLFLN